MHAAAPPRAISAASSIIPSIPTFVSAVGTVIHVVVVFLAHGVGEVAADARASRAVAGANPVRRGGLDAGGQRDGADAAGAPLGRRGQGHQVDDMLCGEKGENTVRGCSGDIIYH